jgi:hypothetical protein
MTKAQDLFTWNKFSEQAPFSVGVCMLSTEPEAVVGHRHHYWPPLERILYPFFTHRHLL